jgi:hypothetical protein
MGQWIKDTSLLWIKNRGAGHTTTEWEVKQLKMDDQHEREKMILKEEYEDRLEQ